jgi:hypothetical protein
LIPVRKPPRHEDAKDDDGFSQSHTEDGAQSCTEWTGRERERVFGVWVLRCGIEVWKGG